MRGLFSVFLMTCSTGGRVDRMVEGGVKIKETNNKK
jgi:hypothetical protein